MSSTKKTTIPTKKIDKLRANKVDGKKLKGGIGVTINNIGTGGNNDTANGILDA
ncbi:MAG TPA: hypothetical protein PK323_02865 [Bacteroidia bacterium]|nr:hypothetical protein [Bacteroidia bacterium]